MAKENLQMRMARSDQKEIDSMRKFLFDLEEKMHDLEIDNDDFAHWFMEEYQKNFEPYWQRLFMGYETMFENALANGVRMVACTMSMDVMGVSKDELIDGIEYGGVATYLAATDSSTNTLFI